MAARSTPPLPLALAQRLCTSAEMQAMDAYAIRRLGIPSLVLMENAAHHVARTVQSLVAPHSAAQGAAPATSRGPAGPIVVCCGRGNNGGDGYAAARLLVNMGLPAVVVALGPAASDDARHNARLWARFGETVDFSTQARKAGGLLRGAGVLVDALFGTGLQRPLEGGAARLVRAFNAAPALHKVAVDVPSGVDGDTGQVLGIAARCTHTVCIQVGKIGLYQHPGAEHAGQVNVVPISIPPRWPPRAPGTYLLTPEFARALRPARPRAGHKGTFGHLLAVCGSAGMAGAAVLCGLGALKAGTGLITMGVPRALRDRFVGLAPELMTLTAAGGDEEALDPPQLATLLAAARERSAVALGCGFGRRAGTLSFARAFVQRCALPLLIDADGLYGLDAALLRKRRGVTVLTPHPGELARLAGCSIGELNADRVGHARRLARAWGVVLVLKGAGTVIAAPDGTAFINPTGDEGLASGGTGDVLSGIVGGLLAQRLPALYAALLGVYVHGLARDLARPHIAGAAFSAGNLVAGINRALSALDEHPAAG
ncbi:MAG: NAD(P)H-hydrate dehydratase [Candidatus Lambdaproteobacteria bacterium]|nr:NAD(P)H-hydrate dehydratase [Candidatus Lambdaproteobacteria bacterium]